MVPEDDDGIKVIYDDLKQINKEYVNESDMNGDEEDESDEIEGQFDDADEWECFYSMKRCV